MDSCELRKYLEEIVISCIYKPITFDGDVVCHLNRWLVTAAIGDKNLFALSPICNPDGKVLSSKEVECLEPEVVEKNWRFYISDDISSFYKRNSPEKLFNNFYDRKQEKYIYCLNSIYCENEMELSIHISTTLPMPMKVWINGNIVFIGTIENFLKDHILSFYFKSGINTILIEKPMCAGNRRLALTPKWFSISTRPLDSIINTTIAKTIDQEEILHAHLSSYTIYTDKLFYEIYDNMKILVLNNSHHYKKDIYIAVTHTNTNDVNQYAIKTGYISYIPLEINHSSVIKISVVGSNDCCYIFVGDYEKYILKLKTNIDQIPLSVSDKLSLFFNLKILDKKRGFIINSIEPIHKYYSQPILSKLFLFEKQYHNGVFNDYILNGFNVFTSPIDNENLAYFLQVPMMSENMIYPLIIYFNFDDSSTKIPPAPNRVLTEKPDNAITLTFCGRGDYMNDYINEFEIISTMNYIVNRFPVDKKRIYFYGICTGARRGFNFLNKYGDEFASMFSLAGTPTEKEDLNPQNPIPTYQLCNIDDAIYNGTTVQKNALNYKAQIFFVSDFEHEELIDYYCNRNTLRPLLTHTNTTEFTTHKTTINETSIKSVYLDRCVIVFSQSEKNGDFSSLLTQPLKYRARNYKFSSILAKTSIDFSQSNFIIIGVLEKLSGCLPNEIVKLATSLISNFNMKNLNDYFIISLEKNPFDCQRKILLIIFSGTKAEKELLSLWGRFDVDPLFNNRQIIYSCGNILNMEEKVNEDH